MELTKASFNYSLKNIPIPSDDDHMRGVISKAENFHQRVRWRVHFFENPTDRPPKENYGFKTTRNAPPNKSLTGFENDMAHLIADLQYSKNRTPFQKRLSNDVRTIQTKGPNIGFEPNFHDHTTSNG